MVTPQQEGKDEAWLKEQLWKEKGKRQKRQKKMDKDRNTSVDNRDVMIRIRK